MTEDHPVGETNLTVEKQRWRTIAASIAPTTIEESAAISATVREVLHRYDWRVVLTFLAMAGEVDLAALRDDTGLTLAVTRTPNTGPLTIHALEEPMERHPFGYLQPGPDARPIDPRGIEVVLVPGLLFAGDGGRLGHGKGYYDRLLSEFNPRPYLIGATVDRRVVNELPMTDRDVRMDAVATETGFREASA